MYTHVAATYRHGVQAITSACLYNSSSSTAAGYLIVKRCTLRRGQEIQRPERHAASSRLASRVHLDYHYVLIPSIRTPAYSIPHCSSRSSLMAFCTAGTFPFPLHLVALGLSLSLGLSLGLSLPRLLLLPASLCCLESPVSVTSRIILSSCCRLSLFCQTSLRCFISLEMPVCRK